MIEATLPRDFEPKGLKLPTRYGKDFDGGYVVSQSDIEAARELLSFGINRDWSFELDFAQTGGAITAYDHTVNQSILRREAIKLLTRFDKPMLCVRAWKTYSSYRQFFQGKNTHLEEMISDGVEGARTFLETISDKKDVYLKCDIEGWEYRILDSLVKHQDQLTGAVIEFHDVDLHLETIREFNNKFGLEIGHINVNNFGPVVAGVPSVIEISYTRHPEKSSIEQANSLNQSNNPSLPTVCVEYR